MRTYGSLRQGLFRPHPARERIVFTNIPERLEDALRAGPADQHVFPMRYLYPAALLIAAYLRRNPFDPNADRFFGLGRKSDGSVRLNFQREYRWSGSAYSQCEISPAFLSSVGDLPDGIFVQHFSSYMPPECFCAEDLDCMRVAKLAQNERILIFGQCGRATQ
jgi:hypothetical protein